MFGSEKKGGKYGAVTPGITHFHDEPPLSNTSTTSRSRSISNYALPSGDSSVFSSRVINQSDSNVLLQPNIDESNAAIGEDSLKESLRKIRLINLLACAMVILLEIPNFFGEVFSLKPARVILGIYLTLFALLLCGYELDMFLSEQIERYFGILYHPIGRSVITLMMGGLAIGQGEILDFLLGFVFIGSAVYTTITYIWYPEYRQLTEERPDLYEEVQEAGTLAHAWTKPAAENLSLLKAGESLSFIQKAMQK